MGRIDVYKSSGNFDRLMTRWARITLAKERRQGPVGNGFPFEKRTDGVVTQVTHTTLRKIARP